MKPEIMWCMTCPASNKRGFFLMYSFAATKRLCWLSLGTEAERLKKAGYRPVKVKVEPVE